MKKFIPLLLLFVAMQGSESKSPPAKLKVSKLVKSVTSPKPQEEAIVKLVKVLTDSLSPFLNELAVKANLHLVIKEIIMNKKDRTVVASVELSYDRNRTPILKYIAPESINLPMWGPPWFRDPLKVLDLHGIPEEFREKELWVDTALRFPDLDSNNKVITLKSNNVVVGKLDLTLFFNDNLWNTVQKNEKRTIIISISSPVTYNLRPLVRTHMWLHSLIVGQSLWPFANVQVKSNEVKIVLPPLEME